jgi:hypothetical protein
MSNERIHSGSNGKKKKKPYIPPTIIKLPLEKAKQLIGTYPLQRQGSDGSAGFSAPPATTEAAIS